MATRIWTDRLGPLRASTASAFRNWAKEFRDRFRFLSATSVAGVLVYAPVWWYAPAGFPGYTSRASIANSHYNENEVLLENIMDIVLHPREENATTVSEFMHLYKNMLKVIIHNAPNYGVSIQGPTERMTRLLEDVMNDPKLHKEDKKAVLMNYYNIVYEVYVTESVSSTIKNYILFGEIYTNPLVAMKEMRRDYLLDLAKQVGCEAELMERMKVYRIKDRNFVTSEKLETNFVKRMLHPRSPLPVLQPSSATPPTIQGSGKQHA
jgi:hypothetical protein